MLGWEVLAIELGAAVECAEAELDVPGDCTTYPVGFVARHEIPDDASGLVDRRPWDD